MLRGSNLDTTGLANVLSISSTGSIAIRVSRNLYFLAQGTNRHRLPSTDTLHLLEELSSRLGGIHVRGNVGIVHGALLENANAVVV